MWQFGNQIVRCILFYVQHVIYIDSSHGILKQLYCWVLKVQHHEEKQIQKIYFLYVNKMTWRQNN